jgi:hypothetical protein
MALRTNSDCLAAMYMTVDIVKLEHKTETLQNTLLKGGKPLILFNQPSYINIYLCDKHSLSKKSMHHRPDEVRYTPDNCRLNILFTVHHARSV